MKILTNKDYEEMRGELLILEKENGLLHKEYNAASSQLKNVIELAEKRFDEIEKLKASHQKMRSKLGGLARSKNQIEEKNEMLLSNLEVTFEAKQQLIILAKKQKEKLEFQTKQIRQLDSEKVALQKIVFSLKEELAISRSKKNKKDYLKGVKSSCVKN